MNVCMSLYRLRPRTHEPAPEFPPLSLDPPSLAAVRPSPLRVVAPETVHVEPEWRGRTARTQYRDSEIYQPLSAMLLGGRALRIALLVCVLAPYNAALGWFAWGAWGSAHTTADQARVIAALAIGVVLGCLFTWFERSYRLRRRFRISRLR